MPCYCFLCLWNDVRTRAIELQSSSQSFFHYLDRVTFTAKVDEPAGDLVSNGIVVESSELLLFAEEPLFLFHCISSSKVPATVESKDAFGSPYSFFLDVSSVVVLVVCRQLQLQLSLSSSLFILLGSCAI